MTAPSLVYVDLYQTRRNLLHRITGRPQTWRWRALNGNNRRVLAISSEAYTNRSDAISAVQQLFGDNSEVYLRQNEQGNQELRLPNAA